MKCAHGNGPGIPCEGCAASRFREVQSPRGKYDLFVARLWSEHARDLEVPKTLKRRMCCGKIQIGEATIPGTLGGDTFTVAGPALVSPSYSVFIEENGTVTRTEYRPTAVTINLSGYGLIPDDKVVGAEISAATKKAGNP